MMKKLLLGLAVCGVYVSVASAQVSVGNGTYTQDFNGMGTGTPAYPTGWNGWKTAGTGTALAANAFVTTATNPAFTTDNGTSTTGTIFNYGTTASTDRALGSIASAGFIGAVGASFTNATGMTLTSSSVNLAFTTELWRSGNNAAAEVMAFSWKIGGSLNDASGWTTQTLFDMTEPNASLTNNIAVDGNAVANRTTLSSTAFTGLTGWTNGSTLQIRWVDANGAGNDSGFGIDDFSLTAVPEPSAYGVVAGAALFLTILARRRRRLSV